jgi:hypothetical protein
MSGQRRALRSAPLVPMKFGKHRRHRADRGLPEGVPMKRCAACGQENDDWRPFCTRCAASFSGAAAEPVLAPPPPGAPAAPPPPGALGATGAPTGPGTHRRPSSAVIALAAVIAVAVGVAAFVGLTGGGSKGHHGAATTTTTFPSTWDPRVDALVRFDAAQRLPTTRIP